MDQEGFGNGSAPNKRQPKPEEQALVEEFAILNAQHGDQFPNICQFLQKESNRIAKGHKSLEEEHFLDIESGKPVRLTYKVSVPVEKYPNFNYVGRLLGPKGSTLKGMQEISGCKLAILGRGSMRDKAKEEQCRQEGGKYSHLNEDLHVWIQAFGPPDMAFYKLYVAAKEVKKYLHADYNDEIFTEQMMALEQEGSLPHGYTASRAAPRGRGGRGMMRGGMSSRGGLGSMGRGGSRGGGMLRGGTRGRGNAMRGSSVRSGRGMHRGGASGSGVSADSLYEDVYEPAPQAYKSEYENGSSSMSGGGGASSAYFDEFPEPRTVGGGDGLGYQRQSHGGYGGGAMSSSAGMGLEHAGMDQSMEGGMYMSHGGMGMGGMKRSMGEMDHPVKFARRY